MAEKNSVKEHEDSYGRHRKLHDIRILLKDVYNNYPRTKKFRDIKSCI